MRTFPRVGLALGLAALGLAGCLPEDGVGYVEVKVFPRLALPLYVNADKIESMKDGVAVLRQAIGKAKLQFERNGQLFPLCEFDVRKNRVTTVTVSTLERGPRCEIQR
jgi:hypothetical protein